MRSVHSVLRYVRRLFRPDNPGVTDAELLERFARKRDEAAFELLIWRHGPMVLGVCLRILQDEHAAEDAFQSTFVALAGAGSDLSAVRSVGGWLFTVASRTARRMRGQAGRRALVEQSIGARDVPSTAGDPADEAARHDLRSVLDAEVDSLPEKYRAVFVLCCVEGKTNEEAAEQLGCPKGTVLSRLSRARERLRQRLEDRGVMLGAVPFAQFLTGHLPELADLPPVLVNATVELSAGSSVGKIAVASIMSLAGKVVEGVLIPMQAKVLAAVLALGVLAAGAGVYALNNIYPVDEPLPTDHTFGGSGCGAHKGCCHMAVVPPPPAAELHGPVEETAQADQE